MRSLFLAVPVLIFPAHVLAQGSSPESVETPTLSVSLLSVTGARSVAKSTTVAAPTGTTQTLTFDEFPIGTDISTQYIAAGIVFSGSGAQISGDFAAPTPPVLTGTPAFEGDITVSFVTPGTNQPTTVDSFTWDIGFFDAEETVRFEWYGLSGQLLGAAVNEGLGYRRYTLSGGEFASVGFQIVSAEPAGFGIDNLVVPVPEQPDLEREKGEVSCALGNPINPAVGNKYQTEEDYRALGLFPLRVARTYNSIGGEWQFFPEVKAAADLSSVLLVRPDGKGLTFVQDGQGGWRGDSDITGSLTQTYNGLGAANGWRYISLDRQEEEYDVLGRVMTISHRSGVAHDYDYAAEEMVIHHSLGSELRFQLDVDGRPTGFIDPDGHQYRYSYDALDRLSSVVYPGGNASRSYHYEDDNFDDLLTGITDANGNRFARWVYDASRRAISSEHAGGAERIKLDYTFTDSDSDPRTTTTNALGKRTTYHYTLINGVRRIAEIEGHATPSCVGANRYYSYDARGFLASKTDWMGNITRYVRNDKGQELSRTEGEGTPGSRTTTTQWHDVFNVPVLISEAGRETAFHYDSYGNLLTERVSDTSQP